MSAISVSVHDKHVSYRIRFALVNMKINEPLSMKPAPIVSHVCGQQRMATTTRRVVNMLRQEHRFAKAGFKHAMNRLEYSLQLEYHPYYHLSFFPLVFGMLR